MTQFDPKKALQEEIAGLGDIIKTLSSRRVAAEERMTQAETELNALMKLAEFAVGERDRKLLVLRELERKELQQ